MSDDLNNLSGQQRQAYLDDIAEFAAGRLSEERAAALLSAARRDPVIMQALRQEEALDGLLELYEFPELPQGLEGRFWARFQQEKLEQEGLAAGRGGFWLRVLGPVAAAAVIALGVVYFTPPSPQAPNTSGSEQAQLPDDGNGPDVDPLMELVVVEPEGVPRAEDLKPEQLKLLKAMDDPRLEALGRLEDAEDARLLEDFETLSELDPGKD